MTGTLTIELVTSLSFDKILILATHLCERGGIVSPDSFLPHVAQILRVQFIFVTPQARKPSTGQWEVWREEMDGSVEGERARVRV